MIEYREGNLLDVKGQVIIHGCNAQGVMGAGVAKQIKEKYPTCFNKYNRDVRKLALGEISWYWDKDGDLWIANAITQEHAGTHKRQLNYVALVVAFREALNFTNSIGSELHFPMIGAGLAGGNWDIISTLINDADPYDLVKKVCWTYKG